MIATSTVSFSVVASADAFISSTASLIVYIIVQAASTAISAMLAV